MLEKKYVNKLCNIMGKNNIDAMMLGPSIDLKFLMKYSPQPDERFQSLFLLSDKRYFYISPEITYEEIRNKLDSNAHIYQWGDHEEFSDIVVAAMNDYKLSGKNIGVNNGID